MLGACAVAYTSWMGKYFGFISLVSTNTSWLGCNCSHAAASCSAVAVSAMLTARRLKLRAEISLCRAPALQGGDAEPTIGRSLVLWHQSSIARQYPHGCRRLPEPAPAADISVSVASSCACGSSGCFTRRSPRFCMPSRSRWRLRDAEARLLARDQARGPVASASHSARRHSASGSFSLTPLMNHASAAARSTGIPEPR